MTYSRYTLIPRNAESKELLWQKYGIKSTAPLDSYLGVAGLPFKITPSAMIKIAYWAQNQSSYQRAEDAIADAMHINVNDDTVRQVTNHVGSIVFQNDCRRAEEAYAILENCRLEYPCDKKGVIYIETDGAALNTRIRNDEGSTWRENKLGEIFSTDHIHFWNNSKGERQHQITKKEYISYIGSVSEFKKHLLACAIRNGYGRYKETVVLSDGATWIRSMVDEIFHGAQQILDYYHLCENVNDFAKHIYNMDELKYKPWASDVCKALRKSRHADVLRDLKGFGTKGLDSCTVNLHTYISNNVNNIDYATYESKGYFIGSGAIESGNKIILQDRLKRAGMRWNVATAQAMLTLKTKAESGLWFSDVEVPFVKHCFALSERA
jgi:hypothetical protein